MKGPQRAQQLQQLTQQGDALMRAGRFQAAEQIARRILDLDARNAMGLKMMGHIGCAMSQFEAAVPWLKKAVAADPRDPRPLCDLGAAHLAGGRFGEAMAAYEKALKIKPGSPQAVAGLVDVLERRGRLDRAAKLLEPFLARGVMTSRLAVLAAVVASRSGDDERALAIAEPFLVRSDVPPPDRQWMLYVVGDARDRLGDVDGAFEAYEAANATVRAPYDPDATARGVDQVLATFSAAGLERLPRGNPDERLPVLVVGMPRSGSTLIEQIIHAHPKGFGAGERADLADIARALPDTIGSSRPFPGCVEDMRPEHVSAAARRYVGALRRAGRGARRVVDKNLQNDWRLGLAAMLCPGVRVIYAQRDPMDVCFSCYIRKLLPALHPYASDLRHLGLYYRQHDRLMRHWRSVLGASLLDVSYARLVAEPEAETRRLIDFLDLEWDDACLRFHEAKRDVNTLSYDQVRKPVYKSAVARYRRYEHHLAPLRGALGDLAD